MIGDTSIPIEIRKDWVWQEIAKTHPEFKRENFPVDDPYLLHDIVAQNCYRYTPKAGDRVMDIGANTGIFTMLCALNGCLVTAYEPNGEALKVLQETARRNGVVINAKPFVIWDKGGVCSYHPTVTPPSGELQTWTSFNGAVNTPGAEPEYITCISLASALGTTEWDCVKMDIEGAEFRILINTPKNTLCQIKYLTVELHNLHADQELHDAFVARLERVFTLDGIKSGDRWASLFCTRR